MARPKNYQPKFTRPMAMEFAQLCANGDLSEIIATARKLAAKMPARSYWQRDFNRLAVILDDLRSGIETVQPFPIFALNGNTKLPFAAFSTLPIVTCPGFGECANFCYSLRAWRYSGAFVRQCQNTVFLRFNRRGIIKAWQSLPQSITVRLYVDGDIDSLETAVFWWNLIGQRPDLDVYGYSKSLPIIEATAARIPPNYTLNLSSGSRHDGDAALIARLMAQPFTRERFVAVKVETTERGSKRYADPEYHRAVRAAAHAAGIGKVFSCPGKCGSCTAKGHACGTRTESGHLVPITIAIGVH